MKHIKLFENFTSKSRRSKLNEEMDIDSGTDNKMRDATPKMEEEAKKIKSLLEKKGLKFQSKNSSSSNESNKLRQDAIVEVQKEGFNGAFGIMQWSDDICQSFCIIGPASAIEVLQQPLYKFGRRINYTEKRGKYCILDVYNSPSESKSIYMETDGEVLFQWDDRENVTKGKLKDKGRSL